MSPNACTEDQFLKDVDGHAMTVLRDDGVNRHIRFKNPAESPYWFDLITWPGSLCIDGDMGTFVFRRLHDMFEFFRTDQEHYNRTGRADKIAIKPRYWSEKLQAPSQREAMEYSADLFRQHVKEAFDNWVESSQPGYDNSTESERDQFDDSKDVLWCELEEGVLSIADDGDVRSYDAAREFKCAKAPGFRMEDCWEWNCREYKPHFIWCCYAIAWAVNTYDRGGAAAQEGGAA